MTHAIAGARARISDPDAVLRQAQAWAAEHGAEVCLADARRIFGRDHLESAALHAERAWDEGTMATRSLSMETLLYVAGERQVVDAIRVAGLKRDTESVAVVLFGPAAADEFLRSVGWAREDGVLSAEGKALEGLGITRSARSTLARERAPDLALERVALVDVEK